MKEVSGCSFCGKIEDKKGRMQNVDGFGLLCNRHYLQARRHGKLFRTRFDKNEIIIKDNHFEIVLHDVKGNERGRTRVSLDKLDMVKDMRWHLTSEGYARSANIYLHRYIMATKDHEDVDHINGDRLNNLNENLRTATRTQNLQNKGLRSDNKSGVTGVSYFKRTNKWHSQIQVSGKPIHLGYFEDIEDAIKVRKEAEQKYFGEFARKDTGDLNNE